MVGPRCGSPLTCRSRAMAGLLAALVVAGCTAGGSVRDRAGSAAPSATLAITPPAQPPQGPGGSQRRYAGMRTTQVGGSPGSVTIFEPDKPTPTSAPVVGFTQGVGPEEYQGWIDHLVGRGSIVVFQNQPFDTVGLSERRKGPLAGLRAAVRALARPGHVRPKWDQLVLVGHSVGGNMAAQLAADIGTQHLPRPKAVFVLQPRLEDQASLRVLAGLAASTLVLASDRDDRVGQEGPKALWAALGKIPAGGKEYVLVRSDEHGTPALVADHFLSLSGPSNPPDALDFYGPWRLLDALQDCAIRRQECRVALGGTTEQRFMGRWSDGVPVTPLQVTDAP